jgi:hypothetical protein
MPHRISYVAFLLALLCAGLLAPLPAARAAPGGPPAITLTAGGVLIEWRPALPPRLGEAGADPLVTLGGVQVPARLVALRANSTVAPQIEALSSVPWRGSLPAAERPIPQTIEGERRPGLALAPADGPPPSPIVVLREGWLRGAHLAVLAITPIFAQGGELRAVTELRATVPGASPLADDAAALLAADGPLVAAPGPSNPAAGKGWKIRVSQGGIQRLPASALAAAGVPLGTPANVRVYRAGQEVALEQRGSGTSLEFRFYAPAPGDRWNAADTYWLVAATTPGLRMAARSAAPGAAPMHGAIERGAWHHNQLYDPYMPGPDGDHWYAVDLKTGTGLPPASLGVPLTTTLSLIAGTTVLTVTGGAYTSGQHNLSVVFGGQAQSASWSGIGDWTRVFTFGANGASATIKLVPGAGPDGVELDSVAWRRPVALSLGGRGAMFDGAAGTWRYQLTGTPAGRALYDVSDPIRPAALAIPTGTDVAFQDGPAARQYVLTGPGTLWTPAISRSQAYDFATPARALYIAPAQFHTALGPLVARRQAQGYSTRVIDVQAIYDAWSYGQVAPEAIRAFLRYAAATWARPPLAVTLVGDGTSDPLNYTGRNNTTFIPPYLAMVDPWLGETACDACYARLDGPDPTLDSLPDLLFGRLPAKSADELAALASKIVAYETAPLDVSWRSRELYVADNADAAGDFAALADASIAQQPAGVDIARMYYDPRSAGVPWREPDALRAYQRTLAALSQGAGLVNYIGHGGPYQWATTDPTRQPPYLLGLYDPDALTNGPRQPIVLEMTCLTGAFQTPAYSGTTIDERLVLKPDGGAIAVWAPTGQGVAHGHDWLQRGFYKALWSAPKLSATVGQLTAGGYLELFASGTCCQDALATYTLLGDPLTTARVLAAERLYAPLARR